MDTQQALPVTAVSQHETADLANFREGEIPAKDLASSVPKFDGLQQGDLILEYTERRGKLIFHVYRDGRKQLVVEALKKAEQQPQDRRYLERLGEELTQRLEAYPWWESTGERLYETFSGFFREEARVVFDPEVDSWSVIVPVPVLPTAWSPMARDALIRKLFTALHKG